MRELFFEALAFLLQFLFDSALFPEFGLALPFGSAHPQAMR